MQLKLILLFVLALLSGNVWAQFNNPNQGNMQQSPNGNTNIRYDRNGQPIQEVDEQESEKEDNIDSLRAKLDNQVKAIVYNAKYIKFTKAEFLTDSTRLFSLDTAANDFQYQSILNQPKHPTMNLGLLGLSTRPMLFEPRKTIGFDVGYHYLDLYLQKPEDVLYYQARSAFTDLYYSTPAFSRITEQTFYAIHSQNVKPNWNIGANLYKTGARTFYGSPNRRAQDLVANNLKAAVWNWYESPNKRYTLLANATFNNLKTSEYGGILNDSIFTVPTLVAPEFEAVRLSTATHNWRNNSIYVKQFYNIGKITNNAENTAVLPSQRVSYSLLYNTQKYVFKNREVDTTGLLRNYYLFPDSSQTNDSTSLKHLQNDFTYSFYLRGKSVSFLKNELKLNVGLTHDLYRYNQYNVNLNFQNITAKANLNYGLNDKASLNGDFKQIIQGRNAGDFFYQAQLDIKLGNKVGNVVFGAYSQNQSPALLYQQHISNHHKWNNSFEKEQTQNASFSYINTKYKLIANAQYSLITNHLYFSQSINGDVLPQQNTGIINFLKLSLEKDFIFGKFTFKNYIVYQKTDFETIIRTPELYTYQSFYFRNTYFKVLKADIGFDVRYFSKYTATSYAPAIGQFYNGDNIRFDTHPIADIWIRTTWKRANLFLKYEYANQSLSQSRGYYTVNGYPMQYPQGKFGVSWKFYD